MSSITITEELFKKVMSAVIGSFSKEVLKKAAERLNDSITALKRECHQSQSPKNYLKKSRK